MNRFRFTLIAVCLVLLYLGTSDLLLWFNNQSPQNISISQLETQGAPQEWLRVTSGYQDLDRGISTSGSLELEALLIPLMTHPDQEQIQVMVETRASDLLELFKEYHFFIDTVPEKQAFRAKHASAFKGQREVTGMLVSGLIASGNQQKLLKLAKQTGLEIADDVIFLSEGKEPGKWRGVFFTAVGLLGLLRVVTRKNQPKRADKENSAAE